MDDRLVSPKFGKVTKPTRCMENEKGTNPEELIAAAHSRCTLEGIDPAS
jgi:organic hydroperoxide reductase OsmC/OhrA